MAQMGFLLEVNQEESGSCLLVDLWLHDFHPWRLSCPFCGTNGPNATAALSRCSFLASGQSALLEMTSTPANYCSSPQQLVQLLPYSPRSLSALLFCPSAAAILHVLTFPGL